MTTEKLIAILRPETEKIDAAMRQDLGGIGNQLLADVLEYGIFNGGKRVRPLLAVLAARLCGYNHTNRDEKELYAASLTFEYLHAASLLHDDVIDRAEMRRGRSAANTVWDNTHVILAGDFLHTRAMHLAGTLGGREALDVICRATSEMVASEFLQLENASKSNTSQEDYYKVLHGKTAALIAAACETGALLAAAPLAMRRELRTFGTNLGLTFQIVDDLLDYLGDPQKTGKSVGNDFQEGKMTLPLLYAIEAAPAEGQNRLLALLQCAPEERRPHFAEAKAIIEGAGGFSRAKEKAAALIREAQEALSSFPDGAAKETLLALASYVLTRDK